MRLRTWSFLILLFTPTLRAEAPPQELFNYEDCLKIFESGEIPKLEKDVLGIWKMVGEGKPETVSSAVLSNRFNSQGIQFYDGSVKKLEFERTTTTKDTFAVRLQNLGSRKAQQGPFRFKAGESGILFSQWPFAGHEIDRSSYYAYTCKKGSSELTCLAARFSTASTKPQPNTEFCEVYYPDNPIKSETPAPTL